MNNFINSDSLKKWVLRSLDFIALGVVLVGGLHELQAGRTDILEDTFHYRMHNGMLRPFDHLFANASLYLMLRLLGLAF